MTREEKGLMIAAARAAADLTQQKMAELLGVTKGAVSSWEQGRSVPTGARAVDLCALLGHSPEWLETGKDPAGWDVSRVERSPRLESRIAEQTPEGVGRKFAKLVNSAIEDFTEADAMRGQIARKIANYNEAQLGVVLSIIFNIDQLGSKGVIPVATAVDSNGEGED